MKPSSYIYIAVINYHRDGRCDDEGKKLIKLDFICVAVWTSKGVRFFFVNLVITEYRISRAYVAFVSFYGAL